MDLENQIKTTEKEEVKKPITRRSFLERLRNTTGAAILLGYAALMGAIGSTIGCGNTGITPSAPRYNLQVEVCDVFTRTPLSGTVAVNGVSGQTESIFSVENGKVVSIKPSIAGYIGGYVYGNINGKDTPINDGAGAHTFTINKDQAIAVYVIPDLIDTLLYGKCNEGTVMNYGKGIIDVGIMKGLDAKAIEPTEDMITTLGKAINLFNQAGIGVISVRYIGRVTSALKDGITNYTSTTTPAHGETVNELNLITDSYMRTGPDDKLRTVLAELTQAASGLRSDGGDDVFPYLDRFQGDNPTWINNAEMVIKLNQILPKGMAINGNAIPAALSIQAIQQKLRTQTAADDFRQGFDDINPFRQERSAHTYVIGRPEIPNPQNNQPAPGHYKDIKKQ